MAIRKVYNKRQYLIEFSRNKYDSIRKVVRRLQDKGYDVETVPNHLTAIVIRKNERQPFSVLKGELIELLDPSKGSLIIGSSSGKQWYCSMKGNRPGRFISIG